MSIRNTIEKKIDKRRRYYLVVDIETANSCDEGLAYDIGFAVTDRKGNIYETASLMVAEMFYNERELMRTAYYAEKLPKYWKELAQGKREMVGILTAKRIIKNIMEQYNISDVFAYNCSFDSRNLNITMRYLTKSKYRWFFPYGTKFHCIQHMACQTILQQQSYFKYAENHGLFTEKGNLSSSAESAYKYITRNADFQEEHQGLQDVLIETQILAKCFAQHKHMETKINRGAWAIPNRAYKEYKKSVA